MLSESSQSDDHFTPIFGFYSVMDIEAIGFCGGYLVLNEIGRPLEFHCTLPVKPERSQEILYGTSLRHFLFCEHIGPPLIGKARNPASIILVNQPPALQLSQHIAADVALISVDENAAPQIKASDMAQAPALERRLSIAAFDLTEPFERIATAIDEAHAATRQDVR